MLEIQKKKKNLSKLKMFKFKNNNFTYKLSKQKI